MPEHDQNASGKPGNAAAADPAKKPEAAADMKAGDVESDQGRGLAPEATNHTDSADAPIINYKTLSWW